MTQLVSQFIADDQGRDLVEYTLLMAFVALLSAALFLSSGGIITAAQ
jgi:Flp pilus assembly pilin Flp